jgi:hypothetical protein
MRKQTLGLILAIFLLAACGQSNDESSAVLESRDPMAVAPADDTTLDQISFANTVPQPQEQAAQERIIIRTANLRLTVENAPERAEEIGGIVQEMGGWIVSSNTFAYDTDYQRAEIIVRVPAERFDEALRSFKDGAIEVESEQITGQDVTDEYVDLQAEIENLRAAEEQLQTIMDSATRVEDVLSVHNQLVSVRGQINIAEGRSQYLSESARYSSITVSLNPEVSRVTNTAGGLNLGEQAENAIETLGDTLELGAALIIWGLLYLLPLALIFLVPLYIAYRLWRRWQKSNKSTAAPSIERG